MSAIASARSNGSPIVVLGGRAPEMRWGSGALQEIDHLPFVSPLTKSAETVKDPALIGDATARADRHRRARCPPARPSSTTRSTSSSWRATPRSRAAPDVPAHGVAEGVEEAAALLAGAERPAIMAGTGLYWARGEGELRALAEALGIPVFLNGMGRGCLPADHEL